MSIKRRSNIEFPFIQPWFATYHEGCMGVIAKNNPASDNWFFNKAILLCTRPKILFADSGSSAKVNVYGPHTGAIPFLQNVWLQANFLRNCVKEVIQTMLEQGYYIRFSGVDDYYVEGKSWYKKKHFSHDGMICGVDNDTKEYIIAAYDSQWVFRAFRTPQAGFVKGYKSIIDNGGTATLNAAKCLDVPVELNISEIKEGLISYLNATSEPNEKDEVFGAAVIPYVIEYLNRLKSGEIPHERIDKRIFRLIWEHKNCMLARLKAVENHCGLSNEASMAYSPIVKTADNIRFAYMKHCAKQNDGLLEQIKDKLLEMTETEVGLLQAFCERI